MKTTRTKMLLVSLLLSATVPSVIQTMQNYCTGENMQDYCTDEKLIKEYGYTKLMLASHSKK